MALGIKDRVEGSMKAEHAKLENLAKKTEAEGGEEDEDEEEGEEDEEGDEDEEDEEEED